MLDFPVRSKLRTSVRTSVVSGTVAIAVCIAGSAGLSGCDAVQSLFAPESVTYEVVKGDTLFEIAQEHGVTVAELKAWNGLSSDTIEIGQQLEIHVTRPDSPRGNTFGSVSARPGPPRTSSGGTSGSDVSDGIHPPDLAMPAAKRCLGGPALGDLSDDQGMVTSQGLGHAEVSAAMNAFLPNVSSCLRGLDSNPSGALTLAISVGCDGIVTGIVTESREDWPDDVAACIVETLHYAPFPAHALPDGDTFVYPLRMQ